MRVNELQAEQTGVNIDVKIIYDQSPAQFKFGHKIKTVIVTDADSIKDGATAFLNLFDKDIEMFKFMDKIRITNAKIRQSKNKRKQLRILYRYSDGRVIGSLEKIHNGQEIN